MSIPPDIIPVFKTVSNVPYIVSKSHADYQFIIIRLLMKNHLQTFNPFCKLPAYHLRILLSERDEVFPISP